MRGQFNSGNSPERPNESPNVAHKDYKRADRGSVVRQTIDGVRYHDRRHDLITGAANGHAHVRRHVPRIRRRSQLHEKHDDPADG